jgi:hypothetical protein
VSTWVVVGNEASRRVLEKCGFVSMQENGGGGDRVIEQGENEMRTTEGERGSVEKGVEARERRKSNLQFEYRNPGKREHTDERSERH